MAVPLLVGMLIGILFAMGVNALFSKPAYSAMEGGEKDAQDQDGYVAIRKVDINGLIQNMDALNQSQIQSNGVMEKMLDELEAMAERLEESIEETQRLSGLLDEALGNEDEGDEEAPGVNA